MTDSFITIFSEHPLVSALWMLSLIHVGAQSKRMYRVGRPFWHIALVGMAAWPLGYFLWLFYWPGTLLRKSRAERESEEWLEDFFKRMKAKKKARSANLHDREPDACHSEKLMHK